MRLINLLKTLRISYTQTIRTYSEYTPKPLRSLKPKSNRQYVQYYVDSCRVRAVGGNGGDGCISFLSAWCKDHAGPDGGDGGHGGHVIFQASHTVKSLNHCRSVIQAKHGGRGDNKDCTGKNAQHVVIPVPLECMEEEETALHIIQHCPAVSDYRDRYLGPPSKFFLTSTQQAPDIAELGAIGETCVYTLEVRSMAHVGLVGFPNAGKSTLLRAVTRARPTVAPYPFTTKQPHIGMVLYDDYEQIAIADLPGLIPGSHKNYGLGIQFLQHLERCRGLIYLLDGASDALQQLLTLQHEVQQYSAELATRPSLLVLNKTDLEIGQKTYEDLKNNRPETVLGISAKTGHNVSELLKAIRHLYDNNL
ncbi:GTP-binding protein 5 [Papilio machaon]|uniref:GTP-binding protein 5 n=1 Tax=Papilio machaon TaxID=76193 RepID=A0A0N0PCX9_PAPMA|nr:GTP-binding protein 5 [Papilio machaon]